MSESRDAELTEVVMRLNALLGTIGLREQLRAASAAAAARALSELNDIVAACTCAGQALELLAKAIVFDFDPEALTRRSQAPSAAFLAGVGHSEVRHLGQVFTVPGPVATNEAFSRLGLPTPDPLDLREAFAARNAAVHLAFADQLTAMGAVGAAFRLMEKLVSAEGIDSADWLESDELANIMELVIAVPPGTDSWSRSYRARLEAQLWNARREVENLRQRLPADVWLSMATQPKDPQWHEDRQLRSCPTGDHFAWYTVIWEEDDVQHKDTPDDLRNEVARLGGMDCGLCGLELDDSDVWELQLSEIVDSRQVER